KRPDRFLSLRSRRERISFTRGLARDEMSTKKAYIPNAWLVRVHPVWLRDLDSDRVDVYSDRFLFSFEREHPRWQVAVTAGHQREDRVADYHFARRRRGLKTGGRVHRVAKSGEIDDPAATDVSDVGRAGMHANSDIEPGLAALVVADCLEQRFATLHCPCPIGFTAYAGSE